MVKYSKKLKKSEGNINLMFSYMLLSIVSLLIAFSINNNKISIMNNKVEDSLVAANLASATVDLEKYATDGIIANIEDEDIIQSYNSFVKALKHNLGLDNNFKIKKEGSIISSKINIDKFIIYSDLKNNIQVSEVSNGNINSYTVKSIKTPNGKDIKDTTIYAKISFKVSTMGLDFNVSKDNVVVVTEK
jgi:hypothetical protein